MAELDSSDRPTIWAIDGGAARVAAGEADRLVLDDTDAIRGAVTEVVMGEQHSVPRSRQLRALRRRIEDAAPVRSVPALVVSAPSRGQTWTDALATGPVEHPAFSVARAGLVVGTELAVVRAVIPDPHSPYHRAAGGQVGLREGLVLAEEVTAVVEADALRPRADKRPIVAVVDVPSQAYGRLEETVGLHQVLAGAVYAYATARTSGHPIVALVVGHAISGGFLAQGLQANQILALDDPGVEIHVMHQAAAARIARRTVEELEAFERSILPMSRQVGDWAGLGLCDALLRVASADHPTDDDIASIRVALHDAVDRARSGPMDLGNRRTSPGAMTHRAGVRAHERAVVIARSPRPHDLLRINVSGPLHCDGPALPSWAAESLRCAPWVVVRRAPRRPGFVPFGIRGAQRQQRQSAWVPSTAILETRRPEDLAAGVDTLDPFLPAVHAARAVRAFFADLGIVGGPTGSVGFAVATGSPAVRMASDLDILIRLNRSAVSKLERRKATTELFDRQACRVDARADVPAGEINLSEYLGQRDRPIMVRRADGTAVLGDPWEAL